MESEIGFEIVLKKPPKGVGFCIQKGRDEKIDYQVSKGKDIRFIFSTRVKQGKYDAPNFLGEYTQGTPKQRFVYICVGQYAGQENTEWARRVKINLATISWKQVEEVLSGKSKILTASYEATGKEGEPVCGSVPLVGEGWVVKKV